MTKEHFTIVKCKVCGFKFTQPRPLSQNLSQYYQSEEYISHSNKNEGLFAWLYQKIRHYTLARKYKLIEKHHSKGKLLDIGCGTGEFLMTGKHRGWNVEGIEPNQGARVHARENYGLTVHELDNLSSLKSNHYDVITLWHVLEHVSNLKETLNTLNRILKDDGLLIIAVPNSDSKDAVIYGKFWAAYDVPRHLYHFTPVTLKKLLNRHHIKVLHSSPMIFDAFYVSLLSEEYIYGKKKFFKGFINGLRSNLWANFHQKNYSSFIFICKKDKT
ncbi:MAG: class I SAM-dependent methyltransferase [Bacteroidales bacterium]